MDMDNYLGGKNGSGVYQAIINLLPPHDTYIEGFLGTGAVMKRKAPALRNIGLDLNKSCIDEFDYAAAELYQCCAFQFLRTFDYESNGRTVLYLDPPYLHETRTSTARYEYELTDEQHRELLTLIVDLPCLILLSGYRNQMYDEALSHWWSVDFQAMSRGGVRTETIWCNFEPGQTHYHTFVGKNFTDRQRIKRKAARWAKKFEALPIGERQALLSALLEILSHSE
ncbi:DNA adenine methylase (plasmid) [Shewanella sp. LC6]|uniref:DNA adenine methylase n=1 Tax=unclassified Shewanella TaxID=196818 RepID=UPI00112C6C5B|nr:MULTISPECIES: DNA adenine methylase [unclassified Shewanella]QQK62510.1 DNA adenine methylase [Shewanella sp. LC6]TPE56232.1 DNA adenine methylase [Shewanella sp. LC2]